MGVAVPTAGRLAELGVLQECLEDARAGRPRALVIRGEAGVGKTHLVEAACHAPGAAGVTLLWGRCVRFGQAAVPCAPIVGALEGWLSRSGPEEQERVLAGAEELAAVLPSLGRRAGRAPGARLLPLLEAVLARICAQRPMALVVDDLQWADGTSLDVLAYLVTGFSEQHLAVLVTCREELPPGHALLDWLADIRRLPAVDELHLARLSERETEEQLTSLLGRAPHPGLARAVFERSGGNPYLTELLTHGLPADAQELPDGLPEELREALVATWVGLSAETRELVRAVAVAGRPVTWEQLLAAAEARGLDEPTAARGVREALDAGVLRTESGRGCWFRHPLLAEVLYEGFLPGEAAPLHEALADVVTHPADRALHLERAGRQEEAFVASLQAAEEAQRVHGFAEESTHLARALRLWHEVPPGVRLGAGSRRDLLVRLSRSSHRGGDLGRALSALDQALALTDRARDPLLASRLLQERYHLRVGEPGLTGGGEPREAVRLSAAYPLSAEYAEALATQAVALFREGAPEAAAQAEQGVRVSLRSGSEHALARALLTRSIARPRGEVSLADAERAQRLAARTGDVVLLEQALLQRSRCLHGLGRLREAGEANAKAFALLSELGAPHLGVLLAAIGAEQLVLVGQWAAAHDLLREALAVRAPGGRGAMARLAACHLAVREGALDHAVQHLQRAEELVPHHRELPGMPYARVVAELRLAAGDPAGALQVVSTALPGQAVADPRAAEELAVQGALAAVALAQRARDHRDPVLLAQVLARVDDLGDAIAGANRDGIASRDGTDPVAGAWRALWVAGTGTCRAAPDLAAAWEEAARACAEADLPWEQALAHLHVARSHLTHGSARSRVSAALRSAAGLAERLGAMPLQREVAACAALARLSLQEPSRGLDLVEDGPLAVLTTREREVLAHLAAGRSYAEVAASLVISEKTVSVHVSNILRKTGTTNRFEAAALAQRHALRHAD